MENNGYHHESYLRTGPYDYRAQPASSSEETDRSRSLPSNIKIPDNNGLRVYQSTRQTNYRCDERASGTIGISKQNLQSLVDSVIDNKYSTKTHDILNNKDKYNRKYPTVE